MGGARGADVFEEFISDILVDGNVRLPWICVPFGVTNCATVDTSRLPSDNPEHAQENPLPNERSLPSAPARHESCSPPTHTSEALLVCLSTRTGNGISVLAGSAPIKVDANFSSSQIWAEYHSDTPSELTRPLWRRRTQMP